MSQYDVAGSLVRTPAAGLPEIIDGITRDSAPPVAWSRTTTLLACGAVVLFAAVALLAWSISGAVVPWDSKNHFYPMFRFLAEGLARGEIPLWNPYHFGGHPSVADPQSLIFTPSLFLFAWLAPGASMQTFDAVIFAHLVAGALAIVGLFRQRAWHPAGAVLAAMIFILGGPASSRLQHTGIIISYAYLPIALLLLDLTLERVRLGWAMLFGVVAALMALGRDQVAYLSCLTLLGMAIGHLTASGEPLRWLRRRGPLLVLAAVVAVAILAVPSLLTMQFLGDSNRPGIAYGVAAAGSLNPVNFITLLAPNIFGSLNWTYDYWGPGYETMAEPDWTDRAINYLFLGTMPALLLIWHGLAGARIAARPVRPFLVTASLAGLYAVGRATPFFGLVFDHLPGVDLYRRPADATFLLNFALGMVAGYLLHRFIAEGLPDLSGRVPRRLAAAFILVATGLTAILVGHALAFPSATPHVSFALVQLGAFVGLAVVVALAMATLCRSIAHRALCAAILVLATGGELVWRNAASSLNAEPASRYVFGVMPQAQAAGLDVLRRELATRRDQGAYPRVEILGLPGAWQNASMVFGLQNTLGYNPLRIAEYARAVGPGENAVDPNSRHFPGTFRGYRCNLAALLGLEYLVLDRPLTRLPRHVPRPIATQIYAADGMYIYKLGRVAPRAYLAQAILPVDNEEILASKTLPDFDRSRTALLDQESLADVRGTYPTTTSGADDSRVSITAYDNNRVSMEVDSATGGVLVLHDLYYPGWQATVDGKPVPVLRTNVLFRGVEVPAGHHVVAFAFHPFALANLSAALEGVLHRSED